MMQNIQFDISSLFYCFLFPTYILNSEPEQLIEENQKDMFIYINHGEFIFKNKCHVEVP